MTREELEKEVEEYLENKRCKIVCSTEEVRECKEGIRVRCMFFNHKKELLINFVEPREKWIEELEQQIKEIKRYLDCEYCEHYTQPCGCKNCNEEIRSDWKLREIKENE